MKNVHAQDTHSAGKAIALADAHDKLLAAVGILELGGPPEAALNLLRRVLKLLRDA